MRKIGPECKSSLPLLSFLPTFLFDAIVVSVVNFLFSFPVFSFAAPTVSAPCFTDFLFFCPAGGVRLNSSHVLQTIFRQITFSGFPSSSSSLFGAWILHQSNSFTPVLIGRRRHFLYSLPLSPTKQTAFLIAFSCRPLRLTIPFLASHDRDGLRRFQ